MEEDTRFSKILKDPRFKGMPRKERKVKIDPRFQAMFTDKKFHTKFAVDKRGKAVTQSNSEDLAKFYELDDEDGIDSNSAAATATEKANASKATKKADISKAPRSAESSVSAKTKSLKTTGKAPSGRRKESAEKKRGTGAEHPKRVLNLPEVSSSDDDEAAGSFDDIRGQQIPDDAESSDDDLTSDRQAAVGIVVEDGVVHGWGELDEDARRIENAETHRLAFCNCDWDKISAEDLYVLCSSFKGTNGIIKSVKVYPSEYGLQRMKEEDAAGPQELREMTDAANSGAKTEDLVEGSAYQMEKLREYQLNRMKYYYAVVECDSVDTANKIYEECDGMEYELSGTRLDIRFIPNDVTFDGEPKSVATGVPSFVNYSPALLFNTALQQTKVRLTWDETDPKRMHTISRKFTSDDIEQMDFKEYLASSSEEEDCENSVKAEQASDATAHIDRLASKDDGDRISKYRALINMVESSETPGKEDEEDMELTWEPGMTLTKEKIFEKPHDEVTESDGDLERDVDSDRESGKVSTSDVGDASAQLVRGKDAGFNDPFFSNVDDNKRESKSSKRKKKKRKTVPMSSENAVNAEEQKAKNALELLMMSDENEEKRHFNLKSIMESERAVEGKKRKKRKKVDLNDAVVDTFEMDVNDPRFGAVYSSHAFALDPSEQHYRKTKANSELMSEMQRRRERNDGGSPAKTAPSDANPDRSKPALNPSLSALVKSVKAKSQSHLLGKGRSKLKS